MRRRGGDHGVALVLVLAVGLLVAMLTAALAFTVTLDAVASRYAQQAVLAEAQAEGALQLAAAEVAARMVAGAEQTAPLPPRLGPWPSAGIAATVTLGETGAGVALRSTATVGRSVARRALDLSYDPTGRPTVRARP